MILIGLKGRLHSGKDTALEYIRKAAGPQLRVERAGFADKMKLSGVRALGFNPKDVAEAVEIADDLKENYFVSVTSSPDSRPISMVERKKNGGYDVRPASISGREFWQRYGTEAHRQVYGDLFHVDALLPRPSEHPSRDNRECDNASALRQTFPGVDVLVVTDARFPNEAHRIIALGGQVWYIDADERLGPLPEDAHISEHPFPPEIPVVRVPNNGTLEQFEYSIQVAWKLGVTDGRK